MECAFEDFSRRNARIIHEIGGDNCKLFREETLWLFFPEHLAIATRSVSEETLGDSSLTRRVTNNPGYGLSNQFSSIH